MDGLDALFLPPEESVLPVQAEMLRTRQRGDAGAALKKNSAAANRLNILAAVAQMANNPGAAKAAELAQGAQVSQYRPYQMGNQGFALPGQGEFVSSPMYEEEQDAARTAKATALAQTLALRKQLADKAAEDKRLLEQEKADRKQELEQEKAERRREMLTMTLEGRRQLAALTAGLKASDKKDGKTLPAGEIRRITDKETIANGFGDLVESFKPEFAGTAGLAPLENTLGKYQPLGIGKSYGDQSNWWQNYNDRKNMIRHELFGSALTASEKAAFDAANINEGMEPSEINRRLRQQHASVVKAYNKLKNNMGRGKYDVSGFEDITEPSVPLPGAKNPGKGGGGKSKAPAGVSQADWDLLTDEEKKLWQ